MTKVLMLTGKNDSNFSFEVSGIDATYEDLYTSKSYDKVFRNLDVFTDVCLRQWKRELGTYDMIFCIDSNITPSVLRWICKHKGDARLIMYFRNKFYESKRRWNLSELRTLPVEIWSYNIHDCEKYGFRYNSQVLNYQIFNDLKNSTIEYSIAFVGSNKGRYKVLEEIYKHLVVTSLPKPYFYMTGVEARTWNRCENQSYLSYSEYLSIASRSIAILDLISEENKGLTFRPLEAMFLKKKLITNYAEIIQYDFYKKDNVFIVGVDDWNSLETFLSSPYVDIQEEIVKSYTTDEWIKRFIYVE